MINRIKNFCVFFVIAFFVTFTSNRLKSDFLSNLFSQDFITLLVAIVAINSTTLGITLTKIREIMDRNGGDFSKTSREMKISIKEQIILIILAFAVQMVGSSTVIKTFCNQIYLITKFISVIIFSYAIQILYDTANSIFLLLNFENDTSD